MNKLPFKEGDILFNETSKKFVYIYNAQLCINDKKIAYNFMVVGNPKERFSASGTEEELALYMTRYGNIDNIDMTLEELKEMDINNGSIKDRGLRMSKFNREIKMQFLTSY